MMTIRVLGSASGFPAADRHASAYLLEKDGRRILIDAGECVSSQLRKHKVLAGTIDTVIITHTHPDHVAGIFLLLQWMFLENRENRLNVYLPEKSIKKFDKFLSWFYIIPDTRKFEIEYFPINPGIFFQQAGLKIEAIPNTHLSIYSPFTEKHDFSLDAFSLWIRQKEGNGLIYTSDVEDLNHLRDVSRDTQVLLTEFTHISLDDIDDFSQKYDIERVILTHIPPERERYICENSEKLQSLNIQCVHDGTLIEV